MDLEQKDSISIMTNMSPLIISFILKPIMALNTDNCLTIILAFSSFPLISFLSICLFVFLTFFISVDMSVHHLVNNGFDNDKLYATCKIFFKYCDNNDKLYATCTILFKYCDNNDKVCNLYNTFQRL